MVSACLLKQCDCGEVECFVLHLVCALHEVSHKVFGLNMEMTILDERVRQHADVPCMFIDADDTTQASFCAAPALCAPAVERVVAPQLERPVRRQAQIL